ncbi:MAG: hypothetical protein LQ351_001985 [Letrouitia transgressa]|nr:MAG: hypothetical protein LQ351_001985 [Letrouitia transgressa]
MSNSLARQQGVRRKLTAMDDKFMGKNVLLVDDSIVRGTTSREIVSMARESGAKKVYFASCAPPITHAHIYGIDLASPSELIAHDQGHDRALESIAQHIGADKVIFQDLQDLKDACSEATVSDRKMPAIRDFEVGVFCGKYVTPVDPGYFEHLERVRGETRKMKVLERAREAVATGYANPKDYQIATNGVEVTGDGQVVPASPIERPNQSPALKGNAVENSSKSLGENALPRDRMDISLHNFADYP